jgi:hypothetical protein
MARVGLTSELSFNPSDVRMADLNESISAVTCGSLQILDVVVPAASVTVIVTPGSGVTAPGVTVRAKGVWVTADVGVAGIVGG